MEDEEIEKANKPRNILEEIVWHKDIEIQEMRTKQPLVMLKQIIDRQPPARDWAGALRETAERTGRPALIAEVKKASPSRGVIQPDFDPVRIARAYEKGGATCLSVLTDSKFFQGGFENLQYIRAAGVTCPLLCKDFIVEAYQIFMARAKGADAVLLIAAVLHDRDMTYLLKVIKGLGMTALIEVHTEREMERVCALDGLDPSYCVLGINNRDLEVRRAARRRPPRAGRACALAPALLVADVAPERSRARTCSADLRSRPRQHRAPAGERGGQALAGGGLRVDGRERNLQRGRRLAGAGRRLQGHPCGREPREGGRSRHRRQDPPRPRVSAAAAPPCSGPRPHAGTPPPFPRGRAVSGAIFRVAILGF